MPEVPGAGRIRQSPTRLNSTSVRITFSMGIGVREIAPLILACDPVPVLHRDADGSPLKRPALLAA